VIVDLAPRVRPERAFVGAGRASEPSLRAMCVAICLVAVSVARQSRVDDLDAPG
jgi:hypothetical protein